MRTICSLLLAVTFAFASAVSAQEKKAVAHPNQRKTVELKDVAGAVKGVATLSSTKDGVKIRLRAHGLEPGEHALHFHQVAKCEGPDFKTAGPHFNPAGKQHGMQNPQGSHAGDMPNFKAKKNGNANFTYVNKAVSLTDEGGKSLFANGGTAIIIHAKADDYKTDPSGNAGDRVACGVITK